MGIEDRIRGLFARACDPGTTEEEARTCAVLLCRLAKKNDLALFIAAAPESSSALLAPGEVMALIANERDAADRRVRLLQANHAAELAQERRRAEVRIERAYEDGRRTLEAPPARTDEVKRAAMSIGAELIDPPVRAPFGVVTWADVGAYLATRPQGTQVELARYAIAHPTHEGAERSIGLPRGQARDWRFPPDARGRGLHAHEHTRTWIAHLDAVHPARNLWGHLRRDVF